MIRMNKKELEKVNEVIMKKLKEGKSLTEEELEFLRKCLLGSKV